MQVGSVAAIFLAAGLSRRFGPDDKLVVPIGQRPLAGCGAAALAGLPFAGRFAIVRSGAEELEGLLTRQGFAVVRNDSPELGLSHSIRLGVQAATGSSGVLIALADMPLIPATHFRSLVDALSEDCPIVATRGPHGPMVPAAFAATCLDALTGLTGEAGARALLGGAAIVEIAPDLLLDVDHPEQLARIRSAAAADPDASRA
jgi:molybdenum cofactor cytidylyltransferase